MRKHKYLPPFFTRTGRGCRHVVTGWNEPAMVCNKGEDDPAHVKPTFKPSPRPAVKPTQGPAS